MSAADCYCGSDQPFSTCCEPLILGKRQAQTAEELMRSRYSAYATVAVEYLVKTTHPSVRKYYSARSIREWAQENSWMRLEIEAVTATTVTFKAYFLDAQNRLEMHHEHSTFRQEKGIWYFLEGRQP